MSQNRQNRPRDPLDLPTLESLALHYAGRYASTRAKLASYLARKLRERGWAGDQAPDIDALVERLAALRYVDDAAYAQARSASMGRRGYGVRRIADTLRAAGVDEPDRSAAIDEARASRWAAAQTFARRRRVGPFASDAATRDSRPRLIAAFIRAGHDYATAAAWVDATPGNPPIPPDQDRIDGAEE